MKTAITKYHKGRYTVGIYTRSYDALTKKGITTHVKKKKYAPRLTEKREFKSEQEALAYHEELYWQIQTV